MTPPTDPDVLSYPIANLKEMLSDRVKIDLSPIELAEILWLAVQRSEGVTSVELPSRLPEQPPIELLPNDPPIIPPIPRDPQLEVKVDIVVEPPESQEDTKIAPTPLPIMIPEAVALRNRREIAKALRPLMRKVPSRLRQAINEEATAMRIAEDKIWTPVVKPEPERWLELAIAIEVTNVFDVWRDTIAEFQHLMQRHGAFRDVRIWQLQTSGNSQPQLFLQTSAGLNRKPRSPRELLDAGGRRLVLFLSDCTSRAWRSGEIFQLLQLWARENPVTIAQLLPEKYWDRSALRLGSLVALRSQLSGALSQDWIVEGLSPRRRQRLRGGLKLPVVTIQPQQLGWWARAMAGVGEQQTTGIVLRADVFQVDEPANSVTETLTAKQLVRRFRGTASAKAQELADMMAVLPVNWSVLRLLQKNLVQNSADNLQETSALYLAEIFLSGLLCPVPIAAEPDQKRSTTQQYDFVEGVRNVLLGAIPISEAREVGEEIATTIFRQLPKEVQDRVNADIARRWGESLSYFEAFLMPDLPWGEDAAAEMLPFAQVTGDVLRRWGNAELAEELEQKVVLSKRESIVDEYVPPSTIRTAIARIFNREGEVVGGGFLVAGRSQNYILTLTDVANQAQVDTTDFDFVPITMTEPQNKVARPRGEIHLDFFEIAAEQKLKAKVVFLSPVYQSPTEPVGFAVLQLEEQLPLGIQAIELLSAHDMQNHHARIFDFSPVGLRNSASSGMLGSKNEDGLVQIEAFIADPIFGGTPVWDEDLKGVVGMAVNLGLRQNINDVFMIPTDVLVKAWDKFKVRHLLSQQGNTRIYSLCTDEPWNLPFDAFVIPVGVGVDLTGSLASALKKHIGEANSLQLEEAIQRILEQKHLTAIAPEDPLIVLLPAEINSLLNPAESDREHFLICATVESPRPTIENVAKAVEAAITLSLERELKRIVISLLGTGVNRLPVDEVAKAMLSKLHQVLSESSSNSIEEIIFVDQKENFIEIVNQVAQSLQNHKLLSLESFQFQQANIEVQIFRSESHIRQDSRSYCDLSERLILSSDPINLAYIRNVCLRGLESLQTKQEKMQFAKAMWMSTDFGEDGIKPVNTCSLQQIVTETSLAMDILQTMGIALDRQNALRYLQELNNGLSNPQLENITDRSLSDNYQQLFKRQPATSGRSLLCTYVEWFHLYDDLVTVVGRKEQPKAIILLDELTKLIPHNWEPECCPKPERIVTFQYTTGQSQQYTEVLAGNVSLDMVLIPQGGFMMGAPEDEEGSTYAERPQHEVKIETFFLGKYPVTQAQYEAVMGKNPSHFKDEKDSPNHPVESLQSFDPVKRVISFDAGEFCRRLSEQTGKEYRLPSEAEWEYACRAGTTTPFHFGETIDAEIVNYDASVTYGRGKKGESREKTTPVGSFKVANAFGLYDMHGNVWEWCEDAWHDNYEGAPSDGSAWVELDYLGHVRHDVFRGGSWSDPFPRFCRSACRPEPGSGFSINEIGFRVACSARGLL